MRFIPLLPFACFALLSGCDIGTDFKVDPVLVADTVEAYAPLPSNAGLPTAIDVASCQRLIGGARFPERVADAGQWDLAIRLRGGQLVFAPPSVVGLPSRASVTPAIAGETFESLIEAPGQGSFVSDSAVAIRPGGVYAVHTRAVDCGFGPGQEYAKLEVLEANAVSGRVLVALVTNERFSDLRLADID